MDENKTLDQVSERPRKRVWDHIIFRREYVSPAMAAEWLTKNESNRSQRSRGRMAYGRDMDANGWKLTGDTIKFDWYDRLIDGQHRLEACVRTGMPFETFVVWGVDPEAQNYVDTGMGRSFRDQLQMRGIKDPGTISALTRRVFLWEPPFNERLDFSRERVTERELGETLDQHPELFDCASFVESFRKKSDVSRSLLAFIYWILSQANGEAAAEFMSKLITGAGLEEDDPILLLRERIASEKGNDNRKYQTRVMWLAVCAWNRWMEGKRISKIQLPKGGVKAGNFPKIRTVRREMDGGDGPVEYEDE